MGTIPRYVSLDKKQGQTPLEALTAWRVANPQYANVPATYAGRLDPMASGVLLILLGEECKKRDAYTGLDKIYEIEVVLDIGTDTGDVLGLAEVSAQVTHPESKEVKQAIRACSGRHLVPYPVFSSKTVNGKPLFLYALGGTLDTITIPKHEEHIYGIDIISQDELSSKDLQKRIEQDLTVVPRSSEPSKSLGADFRQDEIRTRWKEVFGALDERTFTVITFRVTCASGTYMRTLASRISAELGTKGFALSIRRTHIGTFHTFGPFRFWSKLLSS